MIYAGGESEAAKELIAAKCDAYVMHGDPPERVGEKIADMRARRERMGLGPMRYGVAGYTIVRDAHEEAQRELARITDVRASAAGFANFQQWLSGTQLDTTLAQQEYSVSNRGLRSGLVGTPDAVRERVAAFEAVGTDLLLLQCSPQAEEMERFAEAVIAPLRKPAAAR